MIKWFHVLLLKYEVEKKFVVISKNDCQKEKKSNYNTIFHNKLSELDIFTSFHITEMDHSQNRKFKWEICEKKKLLSIFFLCKYLGSDIEKMKICKYT